MFLHVSVILSTGGVCLSACWDTIPNWTRQTPPGTRHPLGDQTPPRTRHPPAQCILGDTVNKRAVCILLECNLNTEFKFIVYLQPFQVVQIILRCSSVRIPKRKLKIHYWFCFIAYLQCTDQEHKAQVHSKILYERRFLSLLVNS